MSLSFMNSANEDEVDSSIHTSESNGNSSGSESGPNNDHQYGDLTIQTFWPKITEKIQKINVLDVRNQVLPLARIKKIMKLDENVKMISAETPMLFAKATELFILELTLRAWVHTEDNKRRTLQRCNVAMAISKYDQFDFLIDIVPREEAKIGICRISHQSSRAAISSDQVQYYFQLAQQQSNDNSSSQNATTPLATNASTIQVVQPATGQIQTVTITGQSQDQSDHVSDSSENIVTAPGNGRIIQLENTSPSISNQSINGLQFVQQIITPNGDVQHIPVRLKQLTE